MAAYRRLALLLALLAAAAAGAAPAGRRLQDAPPGQPAPAFAPATAPTSPAALPADSTTFPGPSNFGAQPSQDIAWVADAIDCANSPGPGCGLSPSSTSATWWPLTKAAAGGCAAALVACLLVRLVGGPPFRRCNRRECDRNPNPPLAARLKGFKLHVVPSMEGLSSPGLKDVLHVFLAMFALLLHDALYATVALIMYRVCALPEFDSFSRLTMAAIPAGHPALYALPLLDAAHLVTRCLLIMRLFKATSNRVTARFASRGSVSAPPSPNRTPLAARNVPASDGSLPAAQTKSPARSPGASEDDGVAELAVAQCCTVVWDKGSPGWWQRAKDKLCFWSKRSEAAPSTERESLQQTLRKLTKRVRRQTHAKSGFRMVASTAGLRETGQQCKQVEKQLREADTTDTARLNELEKHKADAEADLLKALEECSTPDKLATATAAFAAFSSPAANKAFQTELAADPSLSHLAFATAPAASNMRHHQLQMSPSSARTLKLVAKLAFVVMLGACLPGLFRGAASSFVVKHCGFDAAGTPSQDVPSVFAQSSGMDQADVDAASQLLLPETGFCGRSGMMAGVRTVLTNGVPAIMPVAVNEGLISILLIAMAGVGLACLCRTSRERAFATCYAIYMASCFFLTTLTDGSPFKLIVNAVEFRDAVKGGILAMAGNAAMQTRYFWWEYLVTAIALGPAKPLFPMLTRPRDYLTIVLTLVALPALPLGLLWNTACLLLWPLSLLGLRPLTWWLTWRQVHHRLHNAFVKACDWLGTARYCNGDDERPQFPSGDYIASTGMPPYVIASAVMFVSPQVGLLGPVNILVLFVVYSCMFRAHWLGTLDLHGAWTTWLWRMDSECMLLRTAVTFCAAWASAAPPAALALHVLPLVVLALTTWRLCREAAALDGLPSRLAAEQCGDEEQPQDVCALLKRYFSKHERMALEVAERHGRTDLAAHLSCGSRPPAQQAAAAGVGEATPAAAEPLGSPPPSRRRRHSSSSGGSPQPPSTLRRRQQQQLPEAERSGGSRLRFSPAKSMR